MTHWAASAIAQKAIFQGVCEWGVVNVLSLDYTLPMRPRGTINDRLEAGIRHADSGCWEWTRQTDHGGYGRLKVQLDPKPRFMLAHRVSYEFHRGPIPAGGLVLHKCHNRLCINPDHLYVGDHAQNARDTVEAGHSLGGDRQKSFKRTPQLIAKLNDLRASGMRRLDIMAALGIGSRTYARIQSEGLIDPVADRAARSANASAAGKRSRAKQLGREQ